MINSNSIKKFKRTVERWIGNYGSNKGLGTDIKIKEYDYTIDDRGDRKYDGSYSLPSSPDETQTCKGIIINSLNSELMNFSNVTLNDNELLVYIPVDKEIELTSTKYYEIEIDSVDYLIKRTKVIGKLSNTSGVVREIIITKK